MRIKIGSDLESIHDLNIEGNCEFYRFDEVESLNSGTLLVFDCIIYNDSLVTITAESFFLGNHLKIMCIFLTYN